jgi:RNA polymerase sigma-70 factor (ECF subfamily)
MGSIDERFEDERPRLISIATRMLGSASEADDVVQEAWLRLRSIEATTIEDVGAWTTTVVARICLDHLRARTRRREDPIDEAVALEAASDDPEDVALTADGVGVAMSVVLETLAPGERVAFVLYDVFGVPFEEVATVLGRSPVAARQLASRARRRVRGGSATAVAGDVAERRRVVEAFLAASRGGDLGALVALLDPDVVLRSDAAATELGSPAEVVGADGVAATFAGRAQAARLADVDGEPALVWAQGAHPRVAFLLAIEDGRIAAVDVVADREQLLAATIEFTRRTGS